MSYYDEAGHGTEPLCMSQKEWGKFFADLMAIVGRSTVRQPDK